MVEAVNTPIPLALEAEHAAQIMAELEALCRPRAEGAFRFCARGDAIFFLQPAKGVLVAGPERVPCGYGKIHEVAAPDRLCAQCRGARDKCCIRRCRTFRKL